jgi:prevent-host-death family protein
MKTVTIHEAKTHLSRLIRETLSGEEIIIANRDKPLVKLVVYRDDSLPRRVGSARGEIRMSPDFDEPLDDFREYT